VTLKDEASSPLGGRETEDKVTGKGGKEKSAVTTHSFKRRTSELYKKTRHDLSRTEDAGTEPRKPALTSYKGSSGGTKEGNSESQGRAMRRGAHMWRMEVRRDYARETD
jgi:hypothetical protein